MYFEHPVSPTPDTRVAAQSLAVGILELCGLCEELLNLAAMRDAAPQQLAALSEQLEAVRATAAPLASPSTAPPANSSGDTYSLAGLGQWVWRE